MKPNHIRVLAVRQPWASLMFIGGKTSEIRTMNTNIRERIAIYASRTPILKRDIDWLEKSGIIAASFDDLDGCYDAFPQGYILGTVELFDCTKIESKDMFNSTVASHMNNPDWYQEGLYSWNLVKTHMIEEIEFKFKPGQMVWSKTDEVIV